MQINIVNNSRVINKKQNFGASQKLAAAPEIPNSSPVSSAEASKSYASPQITQDYKELETFNISQLGQGKVYQLSNGHKVILIPKIGTTMIYTAVGCGNLNEPADKKELSHVLEHILGNYYIKPQTKEVKETLDKMGAECNASTGDNFTSYYIKAPLNNTDDFENLVKLQAGAIQNIEFTPETLKNEQTIILQEKSSKNPLVQNIWQARALTCQNLFNLKDSDAFASVTTNSTIKNITQEDLINYYTTFYRPDNMTTVICGQVDANAIKTFSKYFNKIEHKPQVNLNKPAYPQIDLSNPTQSSVRKDVQSDNEHISPFIDISFIGPVSSDFKETMLLSALNQTFREKINAYSNEKKSDIDFNITSKLISKDKKAPGLIEIYGETSESNVEENLKTIYSILNDLAQKPISEEELQILKNKMINNDSALIEMPELLSSAVAETAALSQNLDLKKENDFIASIKPEDIRQFAQKYLNLNRASIVVIHPKKETQKSEQTDKTEAKANLSFKGKIDSLDAKDIHEYVLPNNLKVVIDSRPGIARSTITFDLHSQKILYNNPDAAFILSYCLSSKDTKQKLKEQGISLRSDGNLQQIYTTLNANADKTLEMLGYAAGILLNPDLSEERFNEEKKFLKEFGYILDKKHNATINDEMLDESPYHYTKGTTQDLTLDDVRNIHQQILQNAQGTVFITIPPEMIKKVQSEIFRILMQVPAVQPHNYDTIVNKYKPTPLEKTKIITEEEKGEQISIAKAFKIVESGNIKDRAGLLVLNQILGGNEKSKLFNKLRQKDNISYSAYSDFDANSSTGNVSKITLLTKVSSKNKDNLRTVISEYDNSLNELINQPVSQKELETAKASLKTSILDTMESSDARNKFLADNYNSFYGSNYQQALLQAIDNITPEDIQRLAKHYFKQPYIIRVSANEDTLKVNKPYLQSLGEIIEND